jgi:L-galactono-1,4-lactone dehydrogenase
LHLISFTHVCRDITYMQELLRLIESAEVPAPAPIEQRWTAASSGAMSPAAAGAAAAAGSSCSSAGLPADSVFSWVGIIMYLPTEDPQQRQAITDK